jgi:hypothetical protein
MVAQFVPANTWIPLYNNGHQPTGSPDAHNATDPTRFAFRVPAHVNDRPYQEIRVLVESINAPPSLRGQPNEQWYNSSEWNINGIRNRGYHRTHGLGAPHSTSAQNVAATHAARGIMTVDLVGRIGNVVVDDSADPAWSQVFWQTRDGNVLSNTHTSMGISTYFNMFESVQNHLPTNMGNVNRPRHPIARATAHGGFIDRFGTLRNWHNQDMTLLESPSVPYTLPIQRNPLPQFLNQTQKLGYENQFSIQTLGLYGTPAAEMWVAPRYFPIGDFHTMPQAGWQTERFFLFASDPFDTRGNMAMFWDSHLNFGNWQFAPALLGGAARSGNNMTRAPLVPWNPLAPADGTFRWQPDFQHRLNHTLADTRAKINDIERNSPAVQAAVARGSMFTTHIGDPAFIRINADLMTLMGGSAHVSNPNAPALTAGRVGENQPFHVIESSPGGGYQSLAFNNAQRWHGRHSLPRTTQIIWERNLHQGLFEGRQANQYIGVNFVIRTHADNGLWDLAIYTGATALTTAGADPRPIFPNFEVPINTEPWEIRLPSPQPNFQGGRGVRRPTRSWFWPPGNPSDPGFPSSPYRNPQTPLIVLDYSSPAQTDRTTIGTH